MIDTTTTTVLENRREFGDYWRLRLRIPAQFDVRPGQFVMLRPHGQLEPILRRAMVFYRIQRGLDFLESEFIYRTMGRGTTQLSHLRQADQVDLLGPLGNGFAVDQTIAAGQEVALVSGGVGVPALYLLAEQLLTRDIKPRLFHGDRTSDTEQGLICLDDFHELLGQGSIVCATEDGSCGERGFVTVPLEAALRSGALRPAAIYTCGPQPMMQRVAELAREFNIPTQVSLEAQMACGFGVCIACAQRVKMNGRQKYVRVCMEGPIFRADEVVWES
ncbi:MAG: dihydroorotate dehydrogenase electron transfer subunit [Acidobacteria bacterium]|nr:dihydroorotate dehydrogenase electron transfer subunit [Acidobacteriota bacterium]